MTVRVYITGASGTGTSTLGSALATALSLPHLDTDDFYWAPSEVPFTVKRPIPERIEMIRAAQGDCGWVLSGSADGWGDPVIADATLIVFLRLRRPLRMVRLRQREAERFGDRIAPGGDMYRNHLSFLDWAASYEDPYFSGRSLHRHLSWLSMQSAPVLELSGEDSTESQLAACLETLPSRAGATG